MNCVELRESLAEIEDGSSAEQRAHLRTCPECSALVAELNSHCLRGRRTACGGRTQSAGLELHRNLHLRREGLIRPQRTSRSLLPSFGSPWGWARWLVPAAAALLITVGVYVRPHIRDVARISVPAVVSAHCASELAIAGLNDDDLLQEVAQQSPAMQAAVHRQSAPGQRVHPGRESCRRRQSE